MSIFRIHCVALAEPQSNYFFTQLEKLFKDVVSYPGSGFVDASVYWWTSRPIHQLSHEPIVWLVPNISKSLVKKFRKITPPSHLAGFTSINQKLGNIAEVYVNKMEGAANQAKMAFHELMHNKLAIGNELHSSDFGFGLNKEMLDGTTAFSSFLDSENIKKMAPALAKPTPQWVPTFGKENDDLMKWLNE
jgi:hypothetical protein